MKHLAGQNDTTIINATIEDGYLIAGLIVVAPFTTSPVTLVDLDTGIGYEIELPEELTNQPTIVALADEYLPLIQIIPHV